jgi:hypothetical protein
MMLHPEPGRPDTLVKPFSIDCKRGFLVNFCMLSAPDPLVRTPQQRGLLWGLYAVLIAALFWAYWPTLREMEQRWQTDPQYSHGFLVPLFALALLYFRRGRLKRLDLPAANWWGIPFLLVGVVL